MTKNKSVVITYGTFDLLHYGHINLLRRARALGDYLIVGLSSDEFNAVKGKKAFFDFENRKKMLESVRYVDEVIMESSWEQKVEDVKKYGASVFVIGDDWRGKFDHLKMYCRVVYLPRTDGVSSSMIKERLRGG
ncbi:MAG TPA: glycerol-3-phosphate cytidylyltransferase [Rickettsiales bacterium]|nr:glycerol-3-phosphate cytidylyltransferase [Rickettsiales bacterium]